METDYKSISNQTNESASNPNYNWKDITPEFFESIKGKNIIINIINCLISLFDIL